MSHPKPPSPPHHALDLISADMAAVDVLISQRLSTSVALVGDVAQYIISAGGKRLRPQLLLLCCGALGYSGTARHTMAAVIEFIHTATLLHDDVVDESTLRRGRPTANARFGNPASVLIGDFLYSRAFQMMVEVQDMRIMEVLSNATNVIAEGEVLQLTHMHNADLSEAEYLQVIRSKTSKLFEASTQVAAILAKAPPALEAACVRCGQALGTAFQVIDDVLDYAGDAALLGKNLGDDLREGGADVLPHLGLDDVHRGDAVRSHGEPDGGRVRGRGADRGLGLAAGQGRRQTDAQERAAGKRRRADQEVASRHVGQGGVRHSGSPSSSSAMDGCDSIKTLSVAPSSIS